MKYWKRIVSVFCVICLLALPGIGSSAAEKNLNQVTSSSIKDKQNQISAAEKEKKELQGSLSNLKKIKKELESKKSDLKSYVEQLDTTLAEVEENITQLKAKILVKEEELKQAEEELNQAQEKENNQREAILTNIRLMYENSGNYVAELLVSSNGLGDMLNKADYIESIVAYSKDRFDEFQLNRQMVELCKESLELEKEILDSAKETVEAEVKNLEELIKQKEKDITEYETSIENKEKAIKEYEADIAAQNEVIKMLEKAIAEERKRLAEQNGGVKLTYDGGTFKFPLASYTRISDDYGNRIDPLLGIQSFHNGVDFAAPKGTAIYAAYDGVVVAAAYHYSMGNYVMIDHGDNLFTIYMHASKLYVKADDVVARGDTIAAVGTTGRSTGNHLHFGVRKDGAYVSPWNYLSP